MFDRLQIICCNITSWLGEDELGVEVVEDIDHRVSVSKSTADGQCMGLCCNNRLGACAGLDVVSDIVRHWEGFTGRSGCEMMFVFQLGLVYCVPLCMCIRPSYLVTLFVGLDQATNIVATIWSEVFLVEEHWQSFSFHHLQQQGVSVAVVDRLLCASASSLCALSTRKTFFTTREIAACADVAIARSHLSAFGSCGGLSARSILSTLFTIALVPVAMLVEVNRCTAPDSSLLATTVSAACARWR